MKTLRFFFFTILLTSCAGIFRQASYATDQAYIGMQLYEFKEIVGKKAYLKTMDSKYTIYKMSDYDALTGELFETKFFYFDSGGKLFKIDEGEFRQSRY